MCPAAKPVLQSHQWQTADEPGPTGKKQQTAVKQKELCLLPYLLGIVAQRERAGHPFLASLTHARHKLTTGQEEGILKVNMAQHFC